MAFRILWVVNAMVAAVLSCFFLAGVADGSVSSSNIALWSGILVVGFAILAVSIALYKAGHPILGDLVLAPVAMAAVAYVLFFAFLIGSGVRWN